MFNWNYLFEFFCLSYVSSYSRMHSSWWSYVYSLIVLMATPPTPGKGWGVEVEKISSYPNPHLLKIVKSNYNRKLKKKLFDLDNTFVSNFHLFILLQNFTWNSKFFNFYNAIIKSLFLLFPWYYESLFFLL